MTPLAVNRKVLAWLLVLPYEDTRTKLRFLHSILYAILVAFLVVGFAASVIFFLKYVNTNLVDSLYAFFQIISCFPLVNAIFIVLLKREKILGIFQSLTKIYDDSEYSFLCKY